MSKARGQGLVGLRVGLAAGRRSCEQDSGHPRDWQIPSLWLHLAIVRQSLILRMRSTERKARAIVWGAVEMPVVYREGRLGCERFS